MSYIEYHELKQLQERERLMTNGDRIRTMPDEELAAFLSEWGERSLAWHSEYGETLAYLQETAPEGGNYEIYR